MIHSYRTQNEDIINSYNKIEESNIISISDNIISLYNVDNDTYEIKSDYIFKQTAITDNILIIKKILERMARISNNNNQIYKYRIIYLSEIIILSLSNFDNNNIFVGVFNKNKKNKESHYKLFLLHLAISYRNTFTKLSKYIPNNTNLFPLIYTKIFFVPLLHNFDKVFGVISKKIDLVLFGNSEYISSVIFDLENKAVIYDTGYLIQKNYKSNFLDFSKKNRIIEEINFFGQKLKNNYFKSGDKNLDKIENCIKLELRATFPKPLFILRFFPILKGVLLIHVFHQYKLSRILISSNGENKYEKYKEIDAAFFDFYIKLEEINNKELILLEKYFFEYFFVLGNNIKEIGRNSGNINKNIMTYKSKEFEVMYLNKQILQIIKDCIGQYYLVNKNKNENDLIYKIKKRLGEEYEKYKKEEANNNINNINNTNVIIEEHILSKSDKININNNLNDNININEYINYEITQTRNILEFTFINFIKEFDLSKILPKNNKINSDQVDNNIINTNDINIQLQESSSDVNEYSKLNLTKDNLELVKRTIIPSATRTTRTNLISKTNSKTITITNTNLISKDLNANIYENNILFNTESRNLKTEEEKEESPFETDEPFKIDITNIANNIEYSKEESGFQSLLEEKHKNN